MLRCGLHQQPGQVRWPLMCSAWPGGRPSWSMPVAHRSSSHGGDTGGRCSGTLTAHIGGSRASGTRLPCEVNHARW